MTHGDLPNGHVTHVHGNAHDSECNDGEDTRCMDYDLFEDQMLDEVIESAERSERSDAEMMHKMTAAAVAAGDEATALEEEEDPTLSNFECAQRMLEDTPPPTPPTQLPNDIADAIKEVNGLVVAENEFRESLFLNFPLQTDLQHQIRD